MSSIEERLRAVRARVNLAADRADRDPAEVEIVAVSKTWPVDAILGAYRAGQRSFGENRVQEFREKRDELTRGSGLPGARWHLIGQLQSNKARAATQLFDIIQSVDSARLARLLDRYAEAAGKKLPVLFQVDFSGLPQRGGFDPRELESAAEELLALSHLQPQGLMMVAPLGLSEEELRRAFRRLRGLKDSLAQRHGQAEWPHLSMGMSEDFDIAVEEGATIVRIGRAIFGERPYP